VWVVNIRRKSIKLLAIVAVAIAVILNAATGDYLAAEQINQADVGLLAGKTIAIDPGHGGIDSGAKYNGLEEKDITLKLALKLGEELKSHGASVVYTRDKDIDYYTRGRGGKRNDLLKRVEIINNSGAALFVSIHTNAIRGAQWYGAEVYYSAKDQINKQLAEEVQQALREFPPGNKRQIKQDSDILVLKDTTIPGVLIEAGFISNPREAGMLADDGYQQKMVEQIAKALAYHFSHNVAR
jgi:N-acetylmuramoyl-L-alanine amidase